MFKLIPILILILINACGTDYDAALDVTGLQFDGVDDYIDFGDIFNSLDIPLTFSFDSKIEDSVNVDLFCTDSDFNQSSNNYFGFWVTVAPDVISCSWGDGGFAGGHRRTGRSWVNLSLNQWYNIVITVNGPQDFQIYLDGVPQVMDYNDGGGGGSVNHNSFPFTLGGVSIGNNSNDFLAITHNFYKSLAIA